MRLLTPIYLKRPGAPQRISEDVVSYVLASNGLFTVRNEPFFRSSVPARRFPSELGESAPFLEANFPPISRKTFESIVAFFFVMAERHRAEAAVLLAWHRKKKRVEIIVPEQEVSASRVSYEIPDLDNPELVLYGDVHSHVDGAAYASVVDAEDELNRPGLHIVLGRVRRRWPEVYVAAVVDGMRFDLDFEDAIAGFQTRAMQPPPEWLDRVRVSGAASHCDVNSNCCCGNANCGDGSRKR